MVEREEREGRKEEDLDRMFHEEGGGGEEVREGEIVVVVVVEEGVGMVHRRGWDLD